MQLLFLGTSAGLDESNNYHSNMLMLHQNKCLLIDCGSDIRFSLKDQKVTTSDIDAIYISHLHADHAGGLEWMGFNCKYKSKTTPPVLYAQEAIMKIIWQNYLSATMNCIDDQIATLESYFLPHPIDNKNQFVWEGIQFQLIKTPHVKRNKQFLPSFGLFFSYKTQTILFTGDTRFDLKLFSALYKRADLIFHDCEVTEPSSGVHAHYKELLTLPSEIKQKMWLYHYQEINLPNAIADGFLGFVKKGQRFKF